jgi:hypothetical protein
VTFGVLTEAKTGAILPMVGVIVGLWLNRKTRKTAFAVVAVCVAAYFGLLAPLTMNARSHAMETKGVTTLSNAVAYLGEGWNDMLHPSGAAARNKQSFLERLSATPYQAFLIHQYDEGRPGDSLQDIWASAVPRAFWPEKPDVTRFGRELYGLATNTSDPQSALAPTYDAEAYWNGGWLAVILVSVLIGLEMGWLTRKWLLLTHERSKDVGILIMAIPSALFGVLVESWIAGTYIGGFLTLFVLINVLDVAGRATIKAGRRRTPRLAPIGYGAEP